MSVEITFQPAGYAGLVAEGISISDAAHRMGVAMFRCQGIECTTCQVTILSGDELLSSPTKTEGRILGLDQLLQKHRLACQAKLERSGEIVVQINPKNEDATNTAGDPATMRKNFGELPLDQKIKTLVQLEALTMYEAMNALIDKPLAVGEKVFDRIFRTSGTAAKSPKNE
ncbi:MAG TPA: 2Fe-2S iron-sulfur cluster-binding protein [Pyrinomonadaceae bacterium]